MQVNNHILALVVAGVVLLLVIIFFLFRRRGGGASSESLNEQIYIGNLPYQTSDRDLRDEFSQYGQIRELRIVRDRRTGRSKGYAFVTFSNKREAKKSLASHGKELSGRSLVVHVAKPR